MTSVVVKLSWKYYARIIGFGSFIGAGYELAITKMGYYTSHKKPTEPDPEWEELRAEILNKVNERKAARAAAAAEKAKAKESTTTPPNLRPPRQPDAARLWCGSARKATSDKSAPLHMIPPMPPMDLGDSNSDPMEPSGSRAAKYLRVVGILLSIWIIYTMIPWTANKLDISLPLLTCPDAMMEEKAYRRLPVGWGDPSWVGTALTLLTSRLSVGEVTSPLPKCMVSSEDIDTEARRSMLRVEENFLLGFGPPFTLRLKIVGRLFGMIPVHCNAYMYPQRRFYFPESCEVGTGENATQGASNEPTITSPDKESHTCNCQSTCNIPCPAFLSTLLQDRPTLRAVWSVLNWTALVLVVMMVVSYVVFFIVAVIVAACEFVPDILAYMRAQLRRRLLY